MVSAYFQATKRIFAYNSDISSFIRDDRFGVKKLLHFYYLWYINKENPKKFCMISYEDMYKNTGSELRRILEFFGEEKIDEDAMNISIKSSSFESLKRAEKYCKFANTALRPVDPNDDKSYKLRKGGIFGYKEYFSKEDEHYIDNECEKYDYSFKRFARINT